VSPSDYESLKKAAVDHGDNVSKYCRQHVLSTLSQNDYFEKLEKSLRKIFYQAFRVNCAINALAQNQFKDKGYSQFLQEVEKQIENYKSKKEEQ